MATAEPAESEKSAEPHLECLPLELSHKIALCLDDNKDVVAYRSICKETKEAIDSKGHSFWRARFRKKYALKDGVSNAELQKQYQDREKYLLQGTRYNFFRGMQFREHYALEVLRDLIVESFQGRVEADEYGRPMCKNLLHLKDFALNSKLILNSRRAPKSTTSEKPYINPDLAPIKLMCAHFLFDLEGVKQNVFGFAESQYTVYLPTNNARLYSGPANDIVNAEWLFHCLNFFRHHMMNKEAESLFENFQALSVSQKPSAWRGPLQEGAHALGKHWKGNWSRLDADELEKIRYLGVDKVDSEYFIDKDVEDGTIQSLELNFDLDRDQFSWPVSLEMRLKSLSKVIKPSMKAQDPKWMSIPFTGRGEDNGAEFEVKGWLNPLPPQTDIIGWQRVTLIKQCKDEYNPGAPDLSWAFEGVVLPGGRIILGRWWWDSGPFTFNNDFNGPFIFWAVDPEA